VGASAVVVSWLVSVNSGLGITAAPAAPGVVVAVGTSPLFVRVIIVRTGLGDPEMLTTGGAADVVLVEDPAVTVTVEMTVTKVA
jgi:hypothetical protein